MNYIKSLQEENATLKASIDAAQSEIQAFREYLSSAKFHCGDTLDGYINVRDCMNWSESIYDTLR